MSLELTASAKVAYRDLAALDVLNPMQDDVWKQIVESDEFGLSLLLKSPTGSGKTEAVAVPSIALNKRLIMVYPTRSLVDDQIGRFSAMLERKSLFTNDKPVTLNVDTGATMQRKIWKCGKAETVEGNARRHLYQGDVIITTLDKFLYRFFGYGEPKKSYVFPLRINYGLRKSLICFDEAHSYGDVAFTNFVQLIKMLYERGRDLVLMTATMPKQKQNYLVDSLNIIDYVDDKENQQRFERYLATYLPKRKHSEKALSLVSCRVQTSEEQESNLVDVVLNEVIARYRTEERMIVTLERVQDAVAVWRRLKEETSKDVKLWLYHGRLTQARRRVVYEALKEAESKGCGYLLISTSAIEVGCDLDSHVLITQLCDPDRLIQRAGRCNRRQMMPYAQIVVVGDEIPQWLTSLSTTERHNYDAELKKQAGRMFKPQPLLDCLQSEPQIDYRIQIMFDMLYEYVYEAKLENKPLHEKGLVVTRSWEPSLTICTEIDDKGRPQNAISVPMRSCKPKSDGDPDVGTMDADWIVQKQSFSRSTNESEYVNLWGWECAYFVKLYAWPCNTMLLDFNEEEGWVDLPALFKLSFTRGYRRVLQREEEGQKKMLWYIAALEEPEPSLDG